jgi:hypothetical protein
MCSPNNFNCSFAVLTQLLTFWILVLGCDLPHDLNYMGCMAGVENDVLRLRFIVTVSQTEGAAQMTVSRSRWSWLKMWARI